MPKYLHLKLNRGKVISYPQLYPPKLCIVNGWVELTNEEAANYNAMSHEEKEAFMDSKTPQEVQKKTVENVIEIKKERKSKKEKYDEVPTDEGEE